MTRLILLPWMSDPLAKLQERSLGIHLIRNQNPAVSGQRSHKLPSGTNETSQCKKKNEAIQIYSVHKDLFIHVFFLQGPIKLLVLLRLVFIVHCKVKSREELNKVTAPYQASAHLFSYITSFDAQFDTETTNYCIVDWKKKSERKRREKRNTIT